MRYIIIFFLIWFTNICHAQVTDSLNTTVVQQLENITENNEDVETEDDSYLQEMTVFYRNPSQLNTAAVSTSILLLFLTPIHVQNLISDRELVGKLFSLYELPAVAAWAMQTSVKIRPFVTVSSNI